MTDERRTRRSKRRDHGLPNLAFDETMQSRILDVGRAKTPAATTGQLTTCANIKGGGSSSTNGRLELPTG